LIPLEAGGGILFRYPDRDEPEILLIFRRGVWDLPKGKKEKHESVRECARREVAEEVGCPLPEVVDTIGTTYHEYMRGGKQFGKTTHWFAMKTGVDNEFEPDKKEGIERVKWMSLSAAKEMVDFNNLAEILEEFERWYDEIYTGEI